MSYLLKHLLKSKVGGMFIRLKNTALHHKHILLFDGFTPVRQAIHTLI